MTQAEKTGARIARLRNERGLTQQQLAQQLGVTNKAVSKWETGAGLPDASVLPALARALGTTADALLQGDVQNGEEEENYQMEALAADRPGAFLQAAHTAPIPWAEKRRAGDWRFCCGQAPWSCCFPAVWIYGCRCHCLCWRWSLPMDCCWVWPGRLWQLI